MYGGDSNVTRLAQLARFDAEALQLDSLKQGLDALALRIVAALDGAATQEAQQRILMRTRTLAASVEIALHEAQRRRAVFAMQHDPRVGARMEIIESKALLARRHALVAVYELKARILELDACYARGQTYAEAALVVALEHATAELQATLDDLVSLDDLDDLDALDLTEYQDMVRQATEYLEHARKGPPNN